VTVVEHCSQSEVSAWSALSPTDEESRMTAHRDRKEIVGQRIRRISGLLAVGVALATAATMSAAPAHADTTGDSFLAALTNAGVPYGDPASTVELGQSVCPMLSEPGGSFASTASRMAGNNGISADMAGFFTSIAISMYCPSMLSSFAEGNWLHTLPLPGLQR
jgi:Protein of unknown function (DUF732)